MHSEGVHLYQPFSRSVQLATATSGGRKRSILLRRATTKAFLHAIEPLPKPLTVSLLVHALPRDAFLTFVQRINDWWPVETYPVVQGIFTFAAGVNGRLIEASRAGQIHVLDGCHGFARPCHGVPIQQLTRGLALQPGFPKRVIGEQP